jgi:nucleoside-diphosphate-sugar epimerase
MDKDQIEKALAGVTNVIHCVAAAPEVTIQGTRNMLEAALKAKIKRFVHISTTEVYGNVSGEIDESTPFQYGFSEYADSKIEAEKFCWAFSKKGLPVTVVRPPIVYGPYSQDWSISIAQKLQSGNWGTFKKYGDGLCNLIYVSDLVSGILAASKEDAAIGEAFNLNGPDTLTWNQYFLHFNSALNLPNLKEINTTQLKLQATLMSMLKRTSKLVLQLFENTIRQVAGKSTEARSMIRFAEKTLKTSPTTADLNIYDRDAHYSYNKAKTLLGYTPQYAINKGLDLTVRWLNHLHLIDS